MLDSPINFQLSVQPDSHLCIQENRGDEIWIYCPICETYVRKFDKDFKPQKLADTGFSHYLNFQQNLPNMN